MGDNSIVSKTYNVPNNKEGHMKKKLLATVLSAVMVISMMAGCGAAQTEQSGVQGASRETETKTETTAKETGRGLKTTMAGHLGKGDPPHDREAARSTADRAIFDMLVSEKAFLQARSIFAYISFGSEVSTTGMIEYAIGCGKTVAVPRCDIKKHEMTLYEKVLTVERE